MQAAADPPPETAIPSERVAVVNGGREMIAIFPSMARMNLGGKEDAGRVHKLQVFADDKAAPKFTVDVVYHYGPPPAQATSRAD